MKQCSWILSCRLPFSLVALVGFRRFSRRFRVPRAVRSRLFETNPSGRIARILEQETRRWTTWRHVGDGSESPGWQARERKRERETGRMRERSARGDREEISFSWKPDQRAHQRRATKRFRSFDIPNPPRSCSFCHPSAPPPSALKRHVFCARIAD